MCRSCGTLRNAQRIAHFELSQMSRYDRLRTVLRELLEADAGSVDPRIGSHALRLVDELRCEARGQAVHHADEGGFDIARTGAGGIYVVFRHLVPSTGREHDACAVKVWGPGPAVDVDLGDRWPGDDKVDGSEHVVAADELMLGNDFAITPSLFGPGVAATASVEVRWKRRANEPWAVFAKMAIFLEIVSGSAVFDRALLGSALRQMGVRVPDRVLDLPDASGAAAFVIGPVELRDIPGDLGGHIRDLTRGWLAGHGIITNRRGVIVGRVPIGLL